MGSTKISWHIEQFLKSLDHPHQWYGGRTYAQHGDDLALLNLFGCLRITQPSYLDIGAHHPFELSNTALLYQRGCRGVNVEANPALIEAFNKYRPEDTNVCVAVGPTAGTATLHRKTETCGINSLLPMQGSLFDELSVEVVTIEHIVDQYANGCWPDLLSLDVEGVDYEVLDSIDYTRGGPKVICVEAVSQLGDSTDKLRQLLSAEGYTVHSWCGNNILFVRSDLMDWCK